MSDEEQPNDGRYVTILRWAEGRAADRRERQAQFEALEARVTRSFVEHVDHLEDVHQRQLATTAELAHAVRRVENDPCRHEPAAPSDRARLGAPSCRSCGAPYHDRGVSG